MRLTTTEPHTHKPHLLSVMLEDYFHVRGFNRLIRREQWTRFEPRFEANTLRTLDLLDCFNIKATFFVLGWVAEQQPELVREVANRGHEIASRGLYFDRDSRQMTPDEFREDVRRTADSLQAACGVRPIGYRAARRWTDPSRMWTLDVLAEEGYAYDASFLPTTKVVHREPWRRFAHEHQSGDKSIWEFPVSTCNLGGVLVPVAGGNYLRQLPHTLVKHAVEHWHKTYDAPFAMYFHVWELDTEQPRISAASPLSRVRHYRKLNKLSWVLEDYFSRYNFTGIKRYLNNESPVHLNSAQEIQSTQRATFTPQMPSRQRQFEPKTQNVSPASTDTLNHRLPVTLVVPCYNEAQALRYLSNTLESLAGALAASYDLRFIFVDDCSTDETWNMMQQIFGGQANCKLVRQDENCGVAAAILAGIKCADTEIVCSIDCDCSYDPHELQQMIPMLGEDVAMVTASPYHPRGAVRNVPGWRLKLSQVSSFLYRQTLKQKLHTYTSCFRVYRRSAMLELKLKHTGFLGVAEMLGLLDLQNKRIIEHPATLEVRLFGTSKMKVARTIIGHLGLLMRLGLLRIKSHQSPIVSPASHAPTRTLDALSKDTENVSHRIA